MLYNLFENRDFVSVFAVALLAEGVDRNIKVRPTRYLPCVALLAEGVDRNFLPALPGRSHCVALLAEGVDRNFQRSFYLHRSPVALLAEGVDRNHTKISDKTVQIPSPSSRRAWIEIRTGH